MKPIALNPETSLTPAAEDINRVLQFIIDNDSADVTDVCNGLGIERTRAVRAINHLSANGQVRLGDGWDL